AGCTPPQPTLSARGRRHSATSARSNPQVLGLPTRLTPHFLCPLRRRDKFLGATACGCYAARVSHTCCKRSESSPPGDSDERHADPIEPNPPPGLGLEASGWSVSASVLKKAMNRRAKVGQSPRQSRDGAHRRKDQGHVTTPCPEGHGQGAEPAQRVERGHRDPERRKIHPADG